MLLDEVIAIAGADDFDPQARWRIVRAKILATRGEHWRAQQLVDEALALVEPTDYLPLQGVIHGGAADVAAAAGRWDDATAAVSRALDLFERKQDLVGAAKARARLEELRSAAEASPGDADTIVAT